jgi:hypothetical protein
VVREGHGGGMVQVVGFVGDDPGALPRQRTGRQSLVHGREGTDPPGLVDERPCGSGADGQDPGDFFHCRYFRIRAVVGGGVGWGHALLQVEGLGGVAGRERGDLCLKTLFQAEPLQPDPVEPAQQVSPVAGISHW